MWLSSTTLGAICIAIFAKNIRNTADMTVVFGISFFFLGIPSAFALRTMGGGEILIGFFLLLLSLVWFIAFWIDKTRARRKEKKEEELELAGGGVMRG
ncbi:MAG: hypothetical protein R3B55_03530 [Candidatus Paceibacterota bacterium]